MGWQDAPLVETAPKWQEAPEVGATPEKAPSSPVETRSTGVEDPTIPSLRQGSPSDIHAAATGEQFGPPKPRRESLLPEFLNPNYGREALGRYMAPYTESVVKPLQERLFGSTPEPAAQHPWTPTTPDEQQSYERGQMLQQIVSDPLTLLPVGRGLSRLAGRGVEALTQPRVTRPAGQPPVPIEVPVVESSAVSAQSPAVAPLPSITDVARQSPAQSYERFGQEPSKPNPQLKSAEDILAEQRTAQEARYQAHQAWITERETEKTQGLDIPADAYDPLRQPPQMGPRGPVSADVPGVVTGTQSSPGRLSRGFRHALDVLDGMGPYTRQIRDILQHSVDYSEAGTKQNFLEYAGLLEKTFGPRTLKKSYVEPLMAGDWTHLLNRSARDYGMTSKQADALVELHYVGKTLQEQGVPLNSISTATLKTLVSPQAWERLRGELMDPRIQNVMAEGWPLLTGRVASHPSVQATARLYDPISGKSFPVGAPSPVWPHQSVRDATKQRLAESTLQQIYKGKDYKAQGIDYSTFKDRMVAWTKDQDPTENTRKYAGIEHVRYLDMLKDAKSHNRTVADSLRFYGYDTDPLSVLIKHNLYGLKRAVMLENGEALKALRGQVALEYGGEGASEVNWVDTVIKRMEGISQREDVIDKVNKPWSIAQSILYPAFLKNSYIQNYVLQPNYVFMTLGIRPIAQALWQVFGQKLGMKSGDIAAMANRSGADFPAFMARYHTPERWWEQYSKTAIQGNQFTQSDRITRSLSGMMFTAHADHLIRKWYQNPSTTNAKLLEEGNINPAELLTKMRAATRDTWDEKGMPPIPPEAIQRYAQTMTNRTMGRTGVRSLPAWLGSDTQFAKTFMMLHRQIASNEGVFLRHIFQAPTAGIGLQRGLRAVFGATVAGALYQGIINWVTGNNFFDVNQPLAKSFGNQKEAAFAAKAVLLGTGTFSAGVILSGLYARAGNYGGVTYGVLSPPAATFVDELFKNTMQGKTEKILRQVQPFGPVEFKLRKEDNTARKKRGSTMPGLSTGIGLGQ